MITSRHNETIKEVVKLQSKKHRYNRGVFLVEGQKLYEEALKAQYQLLELYSTSEIENAVQVSENVLQTMATTVSPQNIVAVFKQKSVNIKRSFDKCIVLDNIQDAGNMGSIIRSALGAGFTNIIAVNCVDIYEPKVIRASMGAIFHTDILQCDFDTAVQILKDNNLKIAICSMEGQSIFDTDFPKDIAFVMGNEGNGVSAQFRNLTDLTLSIPMNSKLESLNVGVSSAILMYFYLFKQGGELK